MVSEKRKKDIEKKECQVSSSVYDDVIRTECERHSEFLIPLVNHVFQTKYTRNAKVELLSDMHHDAISSKMELKVTDAYFRIEENGVAKVYHLECQSNGDASMIVRIMEYDFMIALDQMANEIEDGCFESDITLPQTTVLYLRHTEDMPDEFKVRIHYGEQAIDYKAPIVKAQMFTLQEIMEKELYILVPFYLMRYERQMKQSYKTKEAAEENQHKIEEPITGRVGELYEWTDYRNGST